MQSDHSTKTYWIYTLSDPDTGAPFYIGVTSNPRQRFTHHHGTRIILSEKNVIIAKLKEAGKMPRMDILDSFITDTFKLAALVEELWFQELEHRGCKIVNGGTRPVFFEVENILSEIERLKVYAAIPRADRKTHRDCHYYGSHELTFREEMMG